MKVKHYSGSSLFKELTKQNRCEHFAEGVPKLVFRHIGHNFGQGQTRVRLANEVGPFLAGFDLGKVVGDEPHRLRLQLRSAVEKGQLKVPEAYSKN